MVGYGVPPGVQAAAVAAFALCSVPQQDTKFPRLLGCWGRGQLVIPKLKDSNLPGLAEVGG